MALEKLDIISVNSTTTKKDGTPIVNKWGKTSWKVGIKTKQYEGYLNGFLPFDPAKWEGTVQELEVEDDPKWGKQFKLPPKDGSRPMGTPSSGGMSAEQYQKLYSEIYAARQEIVMVRQLLQEKGVLPKSHGGVVGLEYPKGGTAATSISETSYSNGKPVSADDFNFSEDESPF